MSEQYFVSVDANFICNSMDEVNAVIDTIRKSDIAKASTAYNITTNIVKEPTCSKCNTLSENNKEPIVKGHIN